jgi:hypothetical protein
MDRRRIGRILIGKRLSRVSSLLQLFSSVRQLTAAPPIVETGERQRAVISDFIQ